MESGLNGLTIAEAAELLRARRTSPTELVEAVLERIEHLNPQLNAYITVTADEARAAALRAAEEMAAGNVRNPLHGIPIGLKDLYDQEGIPTTAGSDFLRDNVAKADAPTVAALRRAGAIFVGKLNMHEFAFGADSVNPFYGACRNPWNPDHICGGSSGGSGAAVAAGMCLGATGSDTGGSIRIPASVCGVVGFKPTRGLLSTRGLLPLSWSMDHAGPMAKTVRDAALMLNAMLGYDRDDPHAVERPAEDYSVGLDAGVRGLRIGIPSNHFFDDAQSAVKLAVRTAADELGRLGAELKEVTVDLSAAENFSVEPPPELNIPPLRGVAGVWMAIGGAESYTFHQPYLSSHADEYGPRTKAVIELTANAPATLYVSAVRAREQLTTALERQLTDEIDLLLTPATVCTAPTIASIEQQEEGANLAHNTWVFNLTSQPSISVPCGFDETGLPIGLMLSGRKWSDALVLRAAHAYEQATEWHQRRARLAFPATAA
jgi:aspartyl-tRNA(Asn)/glutamyl-tRNA(Gln) amidotransferase subunit A